MQVTPTTTPPPIQSGVVPQEAAKVLPQIQAQASAPIIQRAIDPSSKSDKGSRSRSNSDRGKGGDSGGKSGDGRGGSVNIKV